MTNSPAPREVIRAATRKFEDEVIAPEMYEGMTDDLTDAILSALIEAGYALVPVEPTEADIERVAMAIADYEGDDFKHEDWILGGFDLDDYLEMARAAVQASHPPVQET